MSSRKEVLESIADTIADYREGEISRRTPTVIESWVSQFPRTAQDEILIEMNRLLGQTYISRNEMTVFLKSLVTHDKFCGNDPRAFWKSANLLDIQRGGSSQKEMLAIFGELLQQELGIGLSDCGSTGGPFIYLDDGVFGGGRISQDLVAWIREDAPVKCSLNVVVLALHRLGVYFVEKKLKELIAETKKHVNVTWWRIHELENRLAYRNASDVLWPTHIPSCALADAYIKYITEQDPKYKVFVRTPGSVGDKKFFSSDAARILLEQQFLIAGLEIRNGAPLLPETARPLGAMLLKSFGFGSTIVTFRNCPNNCPLAFWAGDPWYPLFPRSPNSQAFIRKILASLRSRKQ